ncbi:hypothetical protein [Roseibium sp. LAB1]
MTERLFSIVCAVPVQTAKRRWIAALFFRSISQLALVRTGGAVPEWQNPRNK